ncbi:L,D-transpeptidase family protein [Thalassotalea psychrophila]|uniref:L,D-transpeptidase family protein n=1 Tax=Thalassotalea psychrophila TaxID=3065647 RepID=A0ABY9TWY6_9GAMM|nr:L,D-transpeptidase family protein [Colwelliaceae bacterium SQ149]
MLAKLDFTHPYFLTLLKSALLTLLPLSITVYANTQVVESLDDNHTVAIQAIELSKGQSPYQYLIKQSNKQLLWFDKKGLTLSGLSLHRLLADLGWHSLIKINALKSNQFEQHDRVLTKGFLQLIQVSTNNYKQQINAKYELLNAINEDASDELLLSLIPAYDQISHIRKAISEYRFLSQHSWPSLDSSFKPRLGQSHKQVKGIRQILTLLGDLPRKAQTKTRLDVFDSVVVAALKEFQSRHGLEADGKLGPNTYAALKVKPEKRIKQLQVNLWRWFTLPKMPPEKYLLVNIPGYQLSVIEDGEQTVQMKVIVGDVENQTPQMVTEINRVTLNPTWTPTRNIINNELIPEYQQDFLSLKRKNFQLVKGYWKNIVTKEIDDPGLNLSKLLQSYRLVQAAGANNALGYYRFNIPNNYSVYLHDTPVKSLFRQSNRALSHGCIRLEDASLLAKYLLKADKSSHLNKMHKVIESGKTTNLPLKTPLPVYITYQTAWINEKGKLRLSPDIYDLDHKNSYLTQFHATDSNPVITLSQNNF